MGIRVSTELDPNGIKTGAAAVKRSLDSVDKSADKTEDTIRDLERQIAVANVRLKEGDKAARQYAAGLSLSSKASADQVSRVKALTGELYDANKAAGGMSANFGQAGIQIQQFVGQIQGGQNAMLALSQQSADLGIVLGAPMVGVVVALAASVAGILLPSLFDTKDATEELTKAQEALDTVITRSESGVVTFTDKIARLAKVNEQAARVQLAVGIADATEVIRQAGNVANEAIDDLDPFFSIISNGTREIGGAPNVIAHFNKTLEETGTTASQLLQVGDLAFGGLADYVDRLNSELGTTTEQSLELVTAFSQFDGSAASADQLATAVATVAEESGFTNEKLNTLAKTLGESSLTASQAQSTIDLLRQAMGDLGVTVEQNSETFVSNIDVVKDLSKELSLVITEYREGERAAAIMAAQQRAGVDAASAQGQQIALLTGQIYDQRDAIEARTKAERDALIAAAEYNKQMDAFAQEEIEAEKRRREQLDKQVSGIAFGVLSPVEQLRAEEQQKLDILTEYGLLSAEKAKEAERLKTAVAKQGEMERVELARIETNSTLSAAAGGFDALSQLAGQFAGDQENKNKTAIALQKAFAIASAGINLSLAISQAMADPAALTLPQKIANMAAIASAGAGLVTSITSANYATGGYVQGAGTGTSDSINANISNGEFVTRASVTSRNRGALEYMNRTGELPNGGGGVVINNYGSPDSVSVRQEGSLTIIDIDERINAKVPGMMANELRNPQSAANGALRGQYNMTRR